MPSLGTFDRGLITFVCTTAIAVQCCRPVHAAVPYNTAGSSYTQDFDTLPNTPTNATLVGTNKEWQDDATSPAAGYISIPGWYLWHPIFPSGGEEGFNGHQRLRASSGNSTTGSFYSFGTNASTERALGSLVSTTLADNGDSLFMGVRLTNNTGVTLDKFSLTFSGEQWRDQIATPDNPKVLTFGYRTDATSEEFTYSGVFAPVSALNFTAPVNSGTATLDGNVAGKVAGITATITHLGWAPGTDLWLRWADLGVGGSDDGLGIDDVSFSANVGGAGEQAFVSDSSGSAANGLTWNDDQAPVAGNIYRVRSGDTVTIDAPFAGAELRALSGSTIAFDAAGSGAHIPILTLDAGANLTESVAGDFSLGDPTQVGTLLVRGSTTINGFEPGAKFTLNSKPVGAGNLTFNSNGAGSELTLLRANGLGGPIRFNGSGDTVRLTGAEAPSNLEMNSTGANVLSWETTASVNSGSVTFNQPGTLVHAVTATTSNIRLQGPSTLIANAAVMLDLSATYGRDERRLLITGFQGSGNILVKGTSTDPTATSTVDNTTGITLNEFEVGAQGTDPSATSSEPYAGTISTQDYINVEIRRNLPAAKFVVNANGRLETGAQPIPLTVNAGTKMGEVVVNNGGVLEVGFEQSNAVGGVFTEGHHVNHLHLTNAGGRNGNLTLNTGATLRMQINGTSADQFDRIESQGSVALGGTIDVLVNPVACTGNDPCGTGVNPTWSPVLDETFDIIKLVLPTLAGDYDGNGSVGTEDYDIWRSNFGNTTTAGLGADGNRNGVIDSADYVIWRNNQGAAAALGNITGTFGSINIVDPTGALSGAGYTLQAIYGASTVQLKVVAGSGSGAGLAGAVPEPCTLVVLGLGLPALAVRRRRTR